MNSLAPPHNPSEDLTPGSSRKAREEKRKQEGERRRGRETAGANVSTREGEMSRECEDASQNPRPLDGFRDMRGTGRPLL